MKFNFLALFFVFLISNLTTAYAIEVGGHLTEDITWTPDNNPYEVIETIYVDSGVTLTILPGTEIKISGASCTNLMEYNENFWLHNGVSVAKMFWVDGRILAEGTEQDSILFTRLQDDSDYYWGTIYITEEAGMSCFEHCKFEYSAGIGIWLSRVALGVISIYNGLGIIRNCSIINNTSSIITRITDIDQLEISNNTIKHGSDLNTYTSQMRTFEFSFGNSEYGNEYVLVSTNDFIDCFLSFNSGYFINNNLSNSSIFLAQWQHGSHLYGNELSNNIQGISGGHFGDSIYIKNNQFIGGYNGIDINYAYVEITDNYFEGCRIYLGASYLSRITNNCFKDINGTAMSGNVDAITNNIIFNCGIGLSGRGSSQFSNNIFVNNNSVFAFMTDNHIIENEIISLNNQLISFPYNIYGNPIFRNCIIDFELEYPLIDGGGNIIVDSLQAQSIFEDIQNGDFHLAPGSIAIDAGFDTLDYYYPFDLDYNHRVWDGNGNGTAIIDIGPYEYGAPSLGGIQGFTYNPDSGEIVDYVLLKINNQPGEFTFSDSVGSYEYKLPAGVYDVYAKRVFYDDAVEYQIEVFDGEYTQLYIPMYETVDVEEHEIPHNSPLISHISNYPNPFNPETTIKFNLPIESKVELSVYNIKGQKIKTLLNGYLPRGEKSIVWSGIDDENNSVSSGIYMYRIKIGDQSYVKRMLLMK